MPPVESGWIPFVGVGLKFAFGPPLTYATNMFQKHGEVFTLGMFGKRLTFMVGPEAHQPFFKKSDEELSQDEPYRFCVPIFGPGVVYDAEPAVRRQQLRFIGKSLKGDALKGYVPQIVRECEDYFKKHWPTEGEVDLRDTLSELIILTASRCLMGREVREQLFEDVAQLYQDLDEGLTPLSVFFPYLPLPAHKKRDAARDEMVRVFGRIMKSRREHPEEEHNDVLRVFMESRYRDDRVLTDTEVAGLMIALLFAGQHTSSVTSSWTGLLLLKHKDRYMEPLLREIHDVAEQNGGINYEALREMKFLHNCVKEALRMYPPLIFVMREVIEPFYYKNYLIPKGDILFVSPALSMRLGKDKKDLGGGIGGFKEPEDYNPYRFGPDTKEDEETEMSYLGFGAGHHACLGEQFAYVQIKTIWATILRDFDLELVGDLPKPDYRAMVVGPSAPCKIRYRRIPSRW